MLFYSQSIGFTLFTEVLEQKMNEHLKLLKKGLINKRLYRPELRLRNQLLGEKMSIQTLSA